MPPALTENPNSRRQRVLLLLMLGSLAALGPLSIDMYLPAFPQIADDLSTTPSAVQSTLTATILGLGIGGLVLGPLSDTYGRKRPLMIGIVVYVLASFACAVAPNVWLLALARFVQGFSGAAGVVLGRAIARDIHSGAALARFNSTLILVIGLAPILAPSIGSEVLRHTTWPGVFVVLAVFGVGLLVFAGLKLTETNNADSRNAGGLRANLSTFKRLLKDRSFAGYAFACGLGMAVMFTYISGSAFVLQEIYGLSPQAYGWAFGVNALGFVVVAQVGGRIVHRVGPGKLLTVGLIGVTVTTLGFLAAVLFDLPVAFALATLFASVSILGFVPPNASALALQNQGGSAGAASGLLSLLQFSLGGLLAPLAGIAGEDTALPMALLMSGLAITALIIRMTLVNPGKMRALREERAAAAVAEPQPA